MSPLLALRNMSVMVGIVEEKNEDDRVAGRWCGADVNPNFVMNEILCENVRGRMHSMAEWLWTPIYLLLPPLLWYVKTKGEEKNVSNNQNKLLWQARGVSAS